MTSPLPLPSTCLVAPPTAQRCDFLCPESLLPLPSSSFPLFTYSFMGVGIILCCITLIGCISAEVIHGCVMCPELPE
ncbi:hypothetical protein I3843_15G121300 [Carya illinoinensis]|nr:hypothetical protein I3843_15G121300 [Carya illinoinensis]